MVPMPAKPLAYAADFRAAATSASLVALSRARPASDAVELSLCLPAAGEPDRFRRQLGRATLTLAVVGFGAWGMGLAGGIALAVVGHFEIGIAVAFAGFFLGSIVMASAKPLQDRMLNNQAQRRPDAVPALDHGETSVTINVEDPATASKMKIVTDDVGDLYLDGDRRRVVIEGFSHRYLIWGRDVVDARLRRTRLSDFVVITCRVAGGPASLAVALNYYTNETIKLRQQKQLPRPPLVDWLEAALGVTVPDAVTPEGSAAARPPAA